jgi:hypothetical protein
MAYAIVRTDKLAGSWDGSKLVSLKYKSSGTETAIANGSLVVLSGLDTGEREVYVAGAIAANTTKASLVLVATPEVVADERLKSLSDFRNEAGDVARGYKLQSGDIYSVTAEGLTNNTSTTLAVGHIVEGRAGTTPSVVVTATGSGTVAFGKIVGIDNGYYAIQID